MAAALASIAAAQPPGYAEANSCAACHAKLAESYARTGMARSFGAITQGSALPAMKDGELRHDASAQTFSLAVRDGVAWLRRAQDAFVIEKPVNYWIGSGNHARSYLSRSAAGELLELPATWYAENGGHWGMSPGYAGPAHAGFSRKINFSCMFCHNAYPAVEAGQRKTIFPARLPQGIDCQRCHGPGKAHVEAAQRGAPVDQVRGAIVNPARLEPARRMEVCLQCHMETTSLRLPASITRFDRGAFSYRPGEPLESYALHFDHAPGAGHEDKFEFSSSPYRLQKSACFQKSAGQMTCTTCHNPHDVPRGADAEARYSQACRGCHSGALSAAHPAATACISCHMPRRAPSDAVQVAVTDHYIRKRPEAAPSPAVEANDLTTPPYRGPVLPYYPPDLAHTPENELYVAVAQVTHEANLAKGIPLLEAAIARAQPKSGEFYLELAEAYRHNGQPAKAIAAYQQAIARAPADWRPVYGIGNSLAATGDLAGAVRSLRRAAELAPRDAAPLQAMAKVLTRQGRLGDAVATLRKAVDLEPENAEARNDLGAALFRNGDAAGAWQAVREAVRLRPEVAAIRVNLAELAARRGEFAEARGHFEFALRLDPNYYEAHLKLARLLLARGERADAQAHLRKALESPDPAIRKAAEAAR
ncbi:MAG: tetratricopeptide repeat protein [Candidatus Solibacter sp.]